jgi:hypothetical protein
MEKGEAEADTKWMRNKRGNALQNISDQTL